MTSLTPTCGYSKAGALSTVTNTAPLAGAKEELRGAPEAQKNPKDTKRPRRELPDKCVLTYTIVGLTDFTFQLTPQDTASDLCELICREFLSKRIGACDIYDHLWNFEDCTTGKIYECEDGMYDQSGEHTLMKLLDDGHGVGSQLLLTYDYGSTSNVRLTLESAVSDPAVFDSCPRRVPLRKPAGFRKHSVPDGMPTVDSLFPKLAKMPPDEVGLFKPGRKNTEAVVAVHSGLGCVIMNWIPERMESVEELFAALEQGCSKRLEGDEKHGCFIPYWSWEQRIIFTSGVFDAKSQKRYQTMSRDRFDAKSTSRVRRSFLEGVPESYFAKAFPKCNSAYMAKKPADRGWIVYKDGVLKVCRGGSKSIPAGNAPGVFAAQRQYEPLPESVLASQEYEFTTYHDLLCTAEGMWPA